MIHRKFHPNSTIKLVNLVSQSVWLITKGVQCDYTDDPPATNDQLYGPNMCCFFTFQSSVDSTIMQKDAPSAKKFANARWPKHKIAFTTCPIPDSIYVTAVEDNSWDIYGVAYLIPVEEYKTFLTKDTIVEGTGQRMGHAVKASVEVTLQGKTTNIDCNTHLDAGQPAAKPRKTLIEKYKRIFTAAGFPADYIDKISKLPTEDC